MKLSPIYGILVKSSGDLLSAGEGLAGFVNPAGAGEGVFNYLWVKDWVRDSFRKETHKMSIGLGVIGMNPTNMGSTTALLKDVPNLKYELRGMCAKRADVLENYAKQIGVEFWTTDYRELVVREDIDVIAVYSPDHLHAEHCAAAIEAGKHVVCTKPMVTQLDDAKRLVALVREKGVKFLVGQTMRFDLQFQTMRRFFDDGDLGELMAAEAYYAHDLRDVYDFTPWRLHVPQDLMFGGVVHPVDILRCFLGDVEEVHAYGAKGKLTPEYPKTEQFLSQPEILRRDNRSRNGAL